MFTKALNLAGRTFQCLWNDPIAAVRELALQVVRGAVETTGSVATTTVFWSKWAIGEVGVINCLGYGHRAPFEVEFRTDL